jgi:hypothetical protein
LKIRNKFTLVKEIPPNAFDDMPYWEWCQLMEEWFEEIEEEKKNREKQDREQKEQARKDEQRYRNQMPKYTIPKTPKY